MTSTLTTIGDSPQHPRLQQHRRLQQWTGTATGAPVAASVVVLVCVLARAPDHLLQVVGTRAWLPALLVVMVLVNGARALAQAPFTVAHRTGSLPTWVAGQVTALGCAIAVGSVLTIPLYALIRASSAWWLWAWALFAGVTAAGQVAMPLIVRVRSGPLLAAATPLAQRVRTIGARAGVDVGGGAFLAAGKATGQGPGCNAYLVGLGPTRRVVLESGLASWPPPLVDQVVAHEIGHWRLGHTAKRLPLTMLVQLATFALAAWTLSLSPLLRWTGVSGAGDPRSYPVLLALTGVLVLPARLVLATYDRAQERAADRFALVLLAAPQAFAEMLDRAALDGGAPRHLPWWRQIAASHPSIDQRILASRAFACATRPERGIRP